METFVALLRAVNVGGSGALPMADLRAMAVASGLSDVRSYIQSGNLVFTSSENRTAIKTILEARLRAYAGKPVGLTLRRAGEMRAVYAANPFPDAPPAQVGVLFLDAAPPSGTLARATGQDDEEIVLGTREVYIHYPSGMGRSKLKLAVIEGAEQGTMRNLNTVGKLVEMVGR